MCWVIGVSVLAVNLLIKQIPLEKFAFVSVIDLETENKDEFINRYMAQTTDAYNQGLTKLKE